MARGGHRPGAGRKKGQVSKEAAARKVIQVQAAEGGITPLEYMLSILRNESLEQSARFAAAKEAAPYCHNRLAAVEHSGNAESPLETIMRVELIAPQVHGYSSD